MKQCDNQDFKYSLVELDEVDSTNAYLLNRYRAQQVISELMTVSAQYQFKGRGQRSSQGWESNRGENLLFSFIINPRSIAIKDQFIISQMVALAVKEELDIFADGFKIKWPNDIYWHDKKIAGILIETELMGSIFDVAVIGIGLNLHQKEFKGDAPNPISLVQITDKSIRKNEILNHILMRFKTYYDDYLSMEDNTVISQRYLEKLYKLNQMATYSDANGEFKGKIVNVDRQGFLFIEDEQLFTRRYAFKEVRYKG